MRIPDARLLASDGLGFIAPILVEAGGTAAVIITQLVERDGLWALAAGEGTYHCISAYDDAYSPLNSDCG